MGASLKQDSKQRNGPRSSTGEGCVAFSSTCSDHEMSQLFKQNSPCFWLAPSLHTGDGDIRKDTHLSHLKACLCQSYASTLVPCFELFFVFPPKLGIYEVMKTSSTFVDPATRNFSPFIGPAELSKATRSPEEGGK